MIRTCALTAALAITLALAAPAAAQGQDPRAPSLQAACLGAAQGHAARYGVDLKFLDPVISALLRRAAEDPAAGQPASPHAQARAAAIMRQLDEWLLIRDSALTYGSAGVNLPGVEDAIARTVRLCLAEDEAS